MALEVRAEVRVQSTEHDEDGLHDLKGHLDDSIVGSPGVAGQPSGRDVGRPQPLVTATSLDDVGPMPAAQERGAVAGSFIFTEEAGFSTVITSPPPRKESKPLPAGNGSELGTLPFEKDKAVAPGAAETGMKEVIDKLPPASLAEPVSATVGQAAIVEAVEGGKTKDATVAVKPDPNDFKPVLLEVTSLIKIYQRLRAWETLGNYCLAQRKTPESFATELMENGVDFARLKQDAADMPPASRTMPKPGPEWVLAADGGETGFTLHYKHASGTDLHGFRGECILITPVEHPMSMMREFDLMQTWNKYITHSVVLHEAHGGDLTVFTQLWTPWPFPTLGGIVRATADDVLDSHGMVHVNFSSVDASVLTDAMKAKLPPSFHKVHLFDILPGSNLRLYPKPPKTPGGPVRCHFVVTADVRAGMRLVPQFLITFILKVFAPFAYNTAVKILKNNFKDPNGVLPQRIAARPDVYGVIKDHVALYLAQTSSTKTV